MLLLLIFAQMQHAEGTACSCIMCPNPQFHELQGLYEPKGNQEAQVWRKLQELNFSNLQGWTFFETSNAYQYSWLCPFLHRNKQIHLTCEDGILVFGKNLSQFYEGKSYYTMDLTDAEIYLRPLYLQIQVRDSKKKYTIGFHSAREYMFFIKSIKVQLEAKSRQKELWLQRRISFLHRSCANVVRQKTQFCDDSLYDMIRRDLHTQRFVTKIRGQQVWRLRTLAQSHIDRDLDLIRRVSTIDMAADLEVWFCTELGKLGIEATEDNARYILSMEDAQDLEEYMMGFLDSSDPKARIFLQELRIRCGHGPEKPYMKEMPEKIKKKNKKEKSNSNHVNIDSISDKSYNQINGRQTSINSDMANLHMSSPSGELGVGAKKKSKYIPLFSVEGQAKSVIQLPGRHTCECQASKHKLINNCISCGRVVCVQEGAGPCVFCGNLVCTPEDQEVLDRGTKRSEKLRNSLMRGGHLSLSNEDAAKQGAEKAMKHRDKLLEFDRNSVRRTQVIDDECDYYATDANRWLSHDDREKLRLREDELRKARHGSRRDRKITFDFAGRQILDADDDSARQMYNKEDTVIQQVHYGKSHQQESSAPLVNPIYTSPPKFVSHGEPVGPSRLKTSNLPVGFDMERTGNCRIQDKELQEMSDKGMCLSMHQPWASLLIHGIKRHEGRTWYSAHRGRLWIAATVKKPEPEEIADLEHMYQGIYNEPGLKFPADYPTSCLLGCVIVDDCLRQDEYREKYPEGESASPYVFICSNPQQLLVKFPMKGQHKIYRLEPQIHKAAKKGLR
ncbi:hypothetical protein RRG08_063984 [Elysia crispata]|uniref:ASCH domain-containing protein n=1 Tax=Elysia crispata TaxID=231223 RepID=A0AAE1CXI7_9GAST|nr:hypothetical protein RRG08_063984 [Elysia crispata]